MKKRQSIIFLLYGLSFCVFVVVWHFLSVVTNASLILPSPSVVFKTALRLCSDEFFWQHFFHTVNRCFLSFIISLLLGSALGIFSGISNAVTAFSSFPLAVIRTTPVVSFILLALFWFKSSTIPVFVSVLMTFPIMVTAVRRGFENIDKKLLDMAKVYAFTKWQIFRFIKLPSVLPFFLTGAVSTFGLTWKVVAAGEVLCLPQKGAGTLLYTAQVHLETDQVLAISLLLVTFSFILEKLFAFCVSLFLKKGNAND